MDVDDEQLFGGSPTAGDPFAPSNGTLQVPPEVPPSPSNSRSAGRSASVAVYSSSTGAPLSPAPPQSQQSSRKRASHGVSSSSNQESSSRRVYPDVYSLPAAVAYAAAHPRRQIPKFGPYLLLQTLGEGEFGKVKLGLHQDYGEEVAVKLIRRGSVDNAVRFSKIEREIEVLRHLRHPNIVRLYDVIETDKYIGIIIEYASGGELFDHILAHRYLREKDAAKLFAQLISGVSYLHAKKIVHRDLKLENLLLDRNRNVIITDFGFANKFEHKADDLMQTSCGSPCYAAPELVISEGLYVGSAVDIWSCGVILYAMLAGYLPFDDDPANPDGDNINLLYKYIINTKLTFPDYVSDEARDLLGLMLVPDPARRCDLETIKRHPWLRAYSSLFEKTVEDLEAQAMESQNAKRMQYQKMMRAREKESMPQQLKMNRTQSARLDTGSSGAMAPAMSSSASTRTGRGHEFLYETGGQELNPPTTRGGRAVASAIISTSHASAYDDDPFGTHKPQVEAPPPRQHNGEHPHDDGSRSRKSSTRSKTSKSPGKTPAVPPPPPIQSPPAGKKKGGYRHTIQLEYEDSEQPQQPAVPPPPPVLNGSLATPHADVFVSSPSTGAPPFSNGISSAAASSAADSSIFTSSSANGTTETATSATSSGAMDVDESAGENEAVIPMEVSAGEKDGQDTPKKPSRDAANVTTPKGPKTPTSISTSGAAAAGPPSPTTPKVASRAPSMPPLSASPPLKRNPATEPIVPTRAALVDALETAAVPTLPTPAVPPLPPSLAQEERSSTATAVSTSSSAISVTPSNSTASNKSSARHRKGLSLDKFNLGFLGGSTEKRGGDLKTPTAGSKKSIDYPPPAFDPTSIPPSASPSQNPETASTKSKASRRKTLTLMMGEQFGTAKGTRDKSKAHRSVTGPINAASEPALATGSRPVPAKEAPQTADVNGAFNEKPSVQAKAPVTPGSGADHINEMGPGASTGKAKKVMDWFRKRSLAKNAGDSAFAIQPPADPHRPPAMAPFEVRTQEGEPLTPTAETYRSKENGDSSTSVSTPQVVVTAVEGSQPPTWGPSPRSASGQSQASTDTSLSAHSGAKGPSATGVTATSTSSHIPPVAKRAAEALANVAFRNPPAAAATKAFNKALLRVHHGAVDQATITTGSPPEVFEHVTQVLISMGIELQKESEFKYRCIRHKRKKTAGTASGTKESSASSSLSAVNMSGSAASNGVDRRGLPLPSSNSFGSTGGMLRGLLMRRGSHTPTPQLTPQGLEDEERGAIVELPEGAPKEPIYGDRTIDMQDEVRFSVELTRIDRLEDTFSLDIRRLKGNLRSYKFLYDTLRERATPAQ